jgi:hypothetical protein
LVLPQTANAQVIHACVNNSNGDMKIVPAGATCQRNSSPLSWNVAGPAGPPGQGSLSVVDVNGKTVGVLLEPNAATVGRQIGGVWVAITFNWQGFGPDQSVIFYYQSQDCTGPRYMDAASVPVRGIFSTDQSPPSIYFPGAPVSQVTVNSTNGGPNTNCGRFPGPQTFPLGLAQSVPISSLGLTPPFSVK